MIAYRKILVLSYDVSVSGWLLIAEVKSRFDPNTGGRDPNRFIKAVCELGFSTINQVFHIFHLQQ